jgi:hypothetical protein
MIKKRSDVMIFFVLTLVLVTPTFVLAYAQETVPESQQEETVTDPVVLAIAFGGAVSGVIYRTVYPYFERIQEMEAKGEDPAKFLTKYKFTAGISLVISLVTTMALFSGLLKGIDIGAGLGMIFISSFVQAIGWNEITNRVSYKIADRTIEQEAAKKPQRSLIKTAKEIVGTKRDQTETSPSSESA